MNGMKMMQFSSPLSYLYLLFIWYDMEWYSLRVQYCTSKKCWSSIDHDKNIMTQKGI